MKGRDGLIAATSDECSAWFAGRAAPTGSGCAITKGAGGAPAFGACFVATSFGINYQFAQHSLKLWLIDAGYHALQFLLFALILGLWH